MLRRQRKALYGLKLTSADGAGSLESDTGNPFAAKKIEGSAKQHQYHGNCEQLPELLHHP
jgi:hypothetical protein